MITITTIIIIMNENINELEIYRNIKELSVIKIWSVDDPMQTIKFTINVVPKIPSSR